MAWLLLNGKKMSFQNFAVLIGLCFRIASRTLALEWALSVHEMKLTFITIFGSVMRIWNWSQEPEGRRVVSGFILTITIHDVRNEELRWTEGMKPMPSGIGCCISYNTVKIETFKRCIFENSFLSWGQITKEKKANCSVNGKRHRNTAMTHKLPILDRRASI